jgi:transcriptional regulator with XRE-family HTH domain
MTRRPKMLVADAKSDSKADKLKANAVENGNRLRALRGERGLTILELAAKAAVSAGMISQIERGNSNPSINTLQRLCAALDVIPWEFLDHSKRNAAAASAPPFVRRSSQRPQMVFGEGGLVKELLSPQYAENLRFMFVTMPPGTFTEDVVVGPGQKAGYVISGTAELTVGEHAVILEEGDSFQFDSSVNHLLSNPSDGETKVIWIMNLQSAHL